MKLKELKEVYGEEAYAAVVTALIELNGSSGGSRDSTRWRELEGEVQDAQNEEEEAGWRCGDLLILDGDGAREKGSGGEA